MLLRLALKMPWLPESAESRRLPQWIGGPKPYQPSCDNVETMIHVIASIRVKEGALDEYVALFKQNVPNVLAEDGCVQYSPCVDAETGWKTQALDPQRMMVVEQWESMEALQAHARAPHMVAFRKKAGHLVEGMTLQFVKDA